MSTKPRTAEEEFAALQDKARRSRLATVVRESVAGVMDQVAAENKRAAEAAANKPIPELVFAADFMEKKIPPAEFVVQGEPAKGVTAKIGRGGLGKSYLELEKLLSIAGDRLFLGEKVRHGPAVYINGEDPPDEIERRMQKILKDFTPAERARALANFRCFPLLGNGELLTRAERGFVLVTDFAERLIKKIGEASAVSIDTTSRFHGGSENDNAAMAMYVNACERLAIETKSGISAVHHTSKAGARGGEADQYAGRGAAALSDNCRSVMTYVYADEQEVKGFGPAIADAQERDNVVVLSHPKANYGAKAPKRYLLRTNDRLQLIEGARDLFMPLAEWMHSKGLTTITIRTARDRRKDIWPANTPSRDGGVQRVFEGAERDGRLIRDSKVQGGGAQYKLSPGTVGAIERADVGVIQDLEGREFDKHPESQEWLQ